MSTDLPGTTYADGTAGHWGGASEEHEPRRRKRIREAIRYVRSREYAGASCPEYEAVFDLGHGAASAALSLAHKGGYLARLREERRGGSVYVTPEYIGGREVIPHRANKPAVSTIDAATIHQVLTAWNVLGVKADPVTGHMQVLRRVGLDALDVLAQDLIKAAGGDQ